MSFRCYISDRDLLNLLPKLRRDDLRYLPATVPGTNGEVKTASPTYLVCSGLNFKTGWNAGEVPAGTTVNIVGEGFFFVKSVVNSGTIEAPVYNTLELESDAGRQGVVPTLTVGTGKRYVIGGFSERIRIVYEELYRSAGQYRDDSGDFEAKALYVPDTWHGADTALLYLALEDALLMCVHWRDSIYEYWLEEIKARKAAALGALEWQFDFDESGAAETQESGKQTRLVR